MKNQESGHWKVDILLASHFDLVLVGLLTGHGQATCVLHKCVTWTSVANGLWGQTAVQKGKVKEENSARSLFTSFQIVRSFAFGL